MTLHDLLQLGLYLLLGAITIIALLVLGFAFYVLVNAAIDRLQGYARRRKVMATSRSAHELKMLRHDKALRNRLKIRVDNMDLNREKITAKIPFEWENVRR